MYIFRHEEVRNSINFPTKIFFFSRLTREAIVFTRLLVFYILYLISKSCSQFIYCKSNEHKKIQRRKKRKAFNQCALPRHTYTHTSSRLASNEVTANWRVINSPLYRLCVTWSKYSVEIGFWDRKFVWVSWEKWLTAHKIIYAYQKYNLVKGRWISKRTLLA